MRFYEYESRRLVERAGIPVTKYGFCTTAEEARKAAEEIGGPTVIKSQVLTGGRMKAGGVKFADTPEEAEAHAADDPEAGDRRPHAGRRPGRPEGRGRAGVLRRRALGRPRQAPDDALQRHGRDRHRAGRRGAPRPRRPRPPLEPPPHLRLPGEGGRRPCGHDRLGAEPRHRGPRPPRPPPARLRHDAGRDQPARPPLRRLVRRPRRPHGDGGRGGRPPQGGAHRDRRRSRRAPRALRAVATSSATSRRSTRPTTAA